MGCCFCFLFLITLAKLKPLELDRKKNTSEGFLALVLSYIEAGHVEVLKAKMRKE